jgi:hypothetical protein
MHATLAANPSAVVALEYMPGALKDLGFAADDVLRWIESIGYVAYSLHRSGRLARFSADEFQGEYTDLLVSREELDRGAAP